MPTPATDAPASSRPPPAAALLAILADVVAVVAFTLIGRASHDERAGLAGTWTTAWPFLLGAALGWVSSRGWRSPTAMMPTGVAVWLSTVVVGMLLRQATGHGTAVPFVAVATVVLALFLVGWRLLVAARARVLRQ